MTTRPSQSSAGLSEAERHRLRVAIANGYHDHTADVRVAAAVEAILAARLAAVWDEGVDAAFRGAVTRQNGTDVKRRNPYRGIDPDPRTHGLNHAPLAEGTWLAPGFCAGCDELRAALNAPPDHEPPVGGEVSET